MERAGHRHRHRRRDAPRELLEPLRDRARRDRPRQPGRRARPHRPPEPGAAGGRADPRAATRSRCATSSSCARNTGPPDQDHAARARSRCPSRRRTTTTATRPSSRWPTPPRSTRRCATCSPPAPTSSRSTSRTCRRGPRQAREYAIPAINRALEGIDGRRPRCTSASATRRSSTTGRPAATPFLAELDACDATQISIEAAQPRLDLGVLAELAGKDVILGVARPRRQPTSRRPETVAARIRAALEHAPPSGCVAPDCGMKYLPRATAFGKLRAMVAGAAIVRAELA